MTVADGNGAEQGAEAAVVDAHAERCVWTDVRVRSVCGLVLCTATAMEPSLKRTQKKHAHAATSRRKFCTAESSGLTK